MKMSHATTNLPITVFIYIGLSLFKRTLLGFFFYPAPGSGLGAPRRPGIDSARSLGLLSIAGDDAGSSDDLGAVHHTLVICLHHRMHHSDIDSPVGNEAFSSKMTDLASGARRCSPR